MRKQGNDRMEQIEILLSNSQSRPLTFREAANYLNVSRSYLYQLTSKSIIPHYKPGGKKIFFDKKDLDRYLQKNRVSSMEEIRKDAESSERR